MKDRFAASLTALADASTLTLASIPAFAQAPMGTATLMQDDHVGVMIDTVNDERRAFQFRIHAPYGPSCNTRTSAAIRICICSRWGPACRRPNPGAASCRLV